ncbi:DNA-binding protein HU-beta/integration host factor subunit beta [Neorhodopirellula lusitana]|uniref:DNA-binding protein HU-beta/integration host factor subunit beta n=1 Tax=Neorhodopirellula lusitana TaxID=445327 RepID=A0ABY1Q0G2_9BACT|nr:HU family DNA-binding protein [Neorhodopirellula lusitana]SMP53795.1 DNA-binding protein HU-beta/integration host factor subunit beta [Neorhodopirellula lusitana]
MTKKEIVRVISEELGLTQQQTKEVVQRTLDSIVESLVREGRIELRNFGVFEVKPRAARTARNPKTGQQVHVPEKFVVSFKPGKVMEQRVQDLSEQPSRPAWLDAELTDLNATDHSTPEETSSSNNQDAPIRPTGNWG